MFVDWCKNIVGIECHCATIGSNPFIDQIHLAIWFFMCDFIVAMKICERDVYQINCDNHSYFRGDVLGNFYAIIYSIHESMNIWWIVNLYIRIDHLAFEFTR